MAAEVFLDTAYAVALSVEADDLHIQALNLADQLEADGTRLVTTRAVLLEIGNALSKRYYRGVAASLLLLLEADPNVEILPLSEELYARALQLYNTRSDKEWGLVDCVSFIVMLDRGIQDALTSDKHFLQAGFRALLRDGS
ncbi:MAG TPA: PIN domain-containing protein [Ardenticatenaceae bacterium]